jgi:hypothetical protein
MYKSVPIVCIIPEVLTWIPTPSTRHSKLNISMVGIQLWTGSQTQFFIMFLGVKFLKIPEKYFSDAAAETGWLK